MTVHFICMGNVFRSLIAETYLLSRELPDVQVLSSGASVDLSSNIERGYFANTMAVLKRHGIEKYAKNTSHQLTPDRIKNVDITVCMNQVVIDAASEIVELPEGTVKWDVTDIGEGERSNRDNREVYEEDVYNEITTQVDELVKRYSLAK